MCFCGKISASRSLLLATNELNSGLLHPLCATVAFTTSCINSSVALHPKLTPDAVIAWCVGTCASCFATEVRCNNRYTSLSGFEKGFRKGHY